MKKIILPLISMLVATTTYAQQLPIEIVNNSSQDIDIFITAYGDNPFNSGECDSCTTPVETDVFTLDSMDSINLEFFDDVPSGIKWWGYSCDTVPPFLGGPGCVGSVAESLCGDPVWVMIGYNYPGIGTERIGDTSCVLSDNYSQGSFTATWTVVGGTDIIVVFND